MGKEKKLQKLLDRMGKKSGNTASVDDGRKEVNEFIQDNGRTGQKRRAQELNDKINPSYQGVAPIKGMSDEEARSIDEDNYDSPLNHCESDMMHQGGWAKMRTLNSPGTTGNKEGIAHNEKMRGFKLPHQSPLAFKGANSENSSCWDGYKKEGTKPSPSGTGETVNNCVKI